MIQRLRRWSKLRRKYYKQTIRRQKRLVAILVVAIGFSSLILGTMQPSYDIHTADLLNMIAKVESRSNYNAYFGNANNTEIQFTSMSVGEVLAWQRQFVATGSPSSAVGRYQFIDATLQGLVHEQKINESEIFDEALQDKLAVALLERRGIREYAENKISRETFAHNLSKEWAALPKTIGAHPERSYYASDGLNNAQISIGEVLASIATVRKI